MFPTSILMHADCDPLGPSQGGTEITTLVDMHTDVHCRKNEIRGEAF